MSCDDILEYIILLMLFASQVILPIILLFNYRPGGTFDAIYITMIITMIAMYILQLVRLCLSQKVKNKLNFFIKSQLNFVPNYVLVGLAIFLQVLIYKIDNLSAFRIFILCFYYFLHVEVYTLLVMKDFMDKKTYIVGQLSLAVWIVFVTITSIVSKLVDQPTEQAETRNTFLVAYLGLSSPLIKSIMEFMKNSFNLWLAD